jgi:hypothetical protein
VLLASIIVTDRIQPSLRSAGRRIARAQRRQGRRHCKQHGMAAVSRPALSLDVVIIMLPVELSIIASFRTDIVAATSNILVLIEHRTMQNPAVFHMIVARGRSHGRPASPCQPCAEGLFDLARIDITLEPVRYSYATSPTDVRDQTSGCTECESTTYRSNMAPGPVHHLLPWSYA